MTDQILRAIDPLGHVRFFVADTTDMVEEMRNIHNASTTATAAMGRVLTMMSILSLGLENPGDSITVNIKGGGPGGYLVGLTDGVGEARVTADRPEVDIPSREDGHLDVGGWVGRDGTLSLVRGYGMKKPFSGLTELVSGEIAEDFASYFFQSEQKPSIISLGVLVEPDHHVSHAGGLFVQLLPDHTEEDIEKLEDVLETLPSMTTMLSEGLTPEAILKEKFATLEPELLATTQPHYVCHCSHQKMLDALLSIDEADRRQMAEEDGGAEVVCEFCRTAYHFSADELRREGEVWT